MSYFSSVLVTRLVDLAIEEDLAFGDLTSSLLERNFNSTGNVIARQELVACGLPITEKIISRAGLSIEVKTKVKEGVRVKTGTVLQTLKGRAGDITSIERITLNFLQRLCGVATYTRAIVEKAPGIVILDTRKTMPGFRLLDKYSTAVGGAKNHRMHLGEMILVKNNHIDSAPGKNIKERVKNVLSKLSSRSAYYLPVQVEVRTKEELRAVLEFSPQAVLLDNMNDSLISECVTLVKKLSPKTLCEASGGITVARLSSLSSIGVDAASMGSLTTQAPNVDISLRMKD